MNRSRKIILAGLVAASLALPGAVVTAIAGDDHENHGQHKGWEKNHGKRFDRSVHDRRYYRRGWRDDDYRRDARYDRRHDGRWDNRGHHNNAEIRQDFRDVRAARADVRKERTDLRKDYTELRNDRAELRRDIRNGASKAEIMKDRQEIRDDWASIRKNRQELSTAEGKLDAARQELKSDLRKR